MKVHEILKESMPDKKAIAKLKQDAKEIKAMADSGTMDINKAMPMMQNMAKIAARADYGSKFLSFAKKMAGAIKKGIDTNQYSPTDLPTMQKAYDSIISQMPQLQKMAADSKALALKYGRTDREKASLDDKGNYKGTNITPTKQQAQQLAREVYDPKHGHDTNSHVVKHKDDNGKAYWAVYNHGKGKGGKIVKTFYSEKGASDFAKKNHDALMNNKMKANETVAGDVGSVAQNMNKGSMIKRNMYNANGTMKNGLDFGNLLGGSSKPKKAKKRRV
tara:strand:+ start:2449 stop:3273 length:825 start_codon:yes stop_codon:yes gene_type:complete